MRTSSQNNSIHKYCELLAEALAEEGHTMQDVIEKIRKMEITPTKESVKEILWKSAQKALFGKESSAELETNEVDKVYEVINKFTGQEFHIHVPFPSYEINELTGERDNRDNKK